MAEKFYDIIPPDINEGKKVFNGKLPNQKKPSRMKEILLGGLLFIVLVAVFMYFQLPRVTIEIWPKTNLLTFREVIIVDKNATDIDLINKTIPGEVIEAQKELWREFSATGTTEEGNKATGTIKVYNRYMPPTPLDLVKKTKFLSESGKYFISPNPIHIPPATKQGGEIVPGVTEIEVVAFETGEGYNIGPAEFSVPGLAGTPYYYTTYGRSEQPMMGGSLKENKYVTQEDIDKAESDLQQQLLNDIEVALKNKISSDYILLEDAVSKEVKEVMSLVKKGDEVENFNVQGEAQGEALIFKKEALEDFIKDYIFSKIPSSKKLFEESLEINYTPERITLEEGKIILNLEFSAKIYPVQETEELFNIAKGRKAEAIKEAIYTNYPDEISRVEVKLWPFWVRKAPGNINRFNIKLDIE